MKDMDKKEHLIILSHPLCITRLDVIIGLLKNEKNIKPRSIPQIIAALLMSIMRDFLRNLPSCIFLS